MSSSSISPRNDDAQTMLCRRKAEIDEALNESVLVEMREKRIDPAKDTFDRNNPQIKSSIIQMIMQYLEEEGYTASMMTVQDEANVKINASARQTTRVRRLQAGIIDGDWNEVEELAQKLQLRKHKALFYALYKQRYLELIDRQEYQKAFTFLTRHLKPLEPRSRDRENKEFADLCYLLTCKSIQEVPSLKDWQGVTRSREKLVEQVDTILLHNADSFSLSKGVSLHRLVHLLQQAMAYQIEFSRFHPKLRTRITSLLEDYQTLVLPNILHNTLYGHTRNVKCVEFVGDEALRIASGSSDNDVRVWNTSNSECTHELHGHSSRVWDISANASGRFVASASGDSTVKVWDLEASAARQCVSTLNAHEGDVYSVQYHPTGTHLVSGGYAKTAQLFDVETSDCVVSLKGHQSSVSSCTFNRHGNLVITGSKDCSVKFWDIVSGVCIKTYSSHLGEVTSVELNNTGTQLLTSSKDNSNRLWDMRMGHPFQRFKGHQNTSRNFVRATFGPNQALVVSGSEDGRIYIWDILSGELVQCLSGHEGTVFSVQWSAHQSLLASCSQDSTIRTWIFDSFQPHFVAKPH